MQFLVFDRASAQLFQQDLVCANADGRRSVAT